LILFRFFEVFHYAAPWMSALMSSTRQAVTRDESFTLDGYLPDLTPCHHVDLPTGNSFKT
jgi:hypothetical protein